LRVKAPFEGEFLHLLAHLTRERDLIQLDWRNRKQSPQRGRRPAGGAPRQLARITIACLTQGTAKASRGLKVALTLLALGQRSAKRHGIFPPALGKRLQEFAEGVYVRGHGQSLP
jgi:hypothetical protein